MEEHLFEICSVVSHYTTDGKGYAVIVIDGKEVKLDGDRMTVEHLVTLIEENSKQIIKA